MTAAQTDPNRPDQPGSQELLDRQAAVRLSAVRSGADWASLLRQVALHPRVDINGVVHDVSSTQPEPAPATASGHPAGLPDALGWLARRHGFTVARERSEIAASMTDWVSRRIIISPDVDAAEAGHLLLHELGHVLVHGPTGPPQDASTANCRRVRKIEADSAAFIVATRLGVNTARYSWPYISSWAGSDPRARPEATVLATASRAATAAGTIIDHLDVALYGRPPSRAVQIETPPQADLEIEHSESASNKLTTKITRVLHDAEQFYLDRRDRSWVPHYLANRGLTAHDIRRWRIGYAPASWTALIDHLRALGHDDDLIQVAGLARKSSRGTLIDHYRDRVMLAIRDESGAIAGFIGRAGPTARPGTPKYLNTPETAVFAKGSLLFGLHENRRRIAGGAVPVIVEGPFDAIAVTAAKPGRYAGLAPCGTALTARQVAALARCIDVRDRLVLVALDGDRAGREAALKSYSLLGAATTKLAAIRLPVGRDPAEIRQAQGTAALASLLQRQAEPLARIVIDARLDRWTAQLGHAEGQLNALRDTASCIASSLSPEAAQRILAITGGQQVRTLDEQMHPIPNPDLPSIAVALPAGSICQIVRIAERLETECSEVIVAVANEVISTIAQPKQPSRDFPKPVQAAASAPRGPPRTPARAAATARPARRTRR